MALSDRAQGWARTVSGRCRAPHLDAGMIAAQARGWSDGRECSGVVHDAGQLALRFPRDAVRAAQASYAEVLAAGAALEACRQRSDMDELALTEAADAARKAHKDTQERLAEALSRMEGVAGRAGDARRAEDEAVRRVERAVPVAETSLARMRGLMAFDALRELLGCPPEEPGIDSGGWLTELRGRLEAVPAPGTPLEDCAAAVRAHLASEDDDWQLGHGQAPDGLPTHQLTLTGCTGMSPPAAAHHAAARLQAAQAAYDTAEGQALQQFVLGRILTAISTAWVDLHTWVKDINTQMKLARASSSLLVQLKVRLTPDLTPSGTAGCDVPRRGRRSRRPRDAAGRGHRHPQLGHRAARDRPRRRHARAVGETADDGLRR
ncbi:hypothetical protein ACFT8W_14685 [Streptomyces hygroscopicus]|uniref:hypothetical protein n=1 Tax=Streptomyces hygroscopicus TaxID=1912 RepID=UPI00362B929C